MAEMQTEARGSRGRSWTAPAGNLSLSVLLRPQGAKPDPGFWALLAGVALYEALTPYSSGLMLKWPNDLLLDGGKLGGILIDSSLADDGGLDWVIIGMGANLLSRPQHEARPTAALPSPGPAASTVAWRVLHQLDRWADADIRSAWLARGHEIGTLIDVVTPQRRIRGRFAGLTSQGALLLQGQSVPISSADIFLAAPPRPGEAPVEANRTPSLDQPASSPCFS